MMKVTVRIGLCGSKVSTALKKDVELSCLPVVGSWVLVDADTENLSFKVGFVDVYVDENAFVGLHLKYYSFSKSMHLSMSLTSSLILIFKS